MKDINAIYEVLILFYKKGKGYFIRNLYGIMILSIFINMLDKVNPITDDKVLSCIYGGILSGIGTALVLRGNGSTGGSDLVSYIVKLYRPEVRTSNSILIFYIVH